MHALTDIFLLHVLLFDICIVWQISAKPIGRCFENGVYLTRQKVFLDCQMILRCKNKSNDIWDHTANYIE